MTLYKLWPTELTAGSEDRVPTMSGAVDWANQWIINSVISHT